MSKPKRTTADETIEALEWLEKYANGKTADSAHAQVVLGLVNGMSAALEFGIQRPAPRKMTGGRRIGGAR
jgi:hypothetical protein